MTPEQELNDAFKRMITAGKQNGAERQYALACEKLRVIHNSVEGNYNWPKMKGKYRG